MHKLKNTLSSLIIQWSAAGMSLPPVDRGSYKRGSRKFTKMPTYLFMFQCKRGRVLRSSSWGRGGVANKNIENPWVINQLYLSERAALDSL